jgi:hypothetical protein
MLVRVLKYVPKGELAEQESKQVGQVVHSYFLKLVQPNLQDEKLGRNFEPVPSDRS